MAIKCFDSIQAACYKKNNKIMPRSVNSVAKRARRKNNEASQRFLCRRKTFGQLLRMR
jgi:hypothetical protein